MGSDTFLNLNRPTPTPGCIRPCCEDMFNLRHSYINNWDKEWPDI